MTPRELSREIDGLVRRHRDDAEQRLALAWNVGYYAVLAFTGKLPRLDEEIRRRLVTVDQELTPEQQQVKVALLSEWMGVRLQPISPEAKAALERKRIRMLES